MEKRTTTRLEKSNVQSEPGVHNRQRIILKARRKLASKTNSCGKEKIATELAICAKKVPSNKISLTYSETNPIRSAKSINKTAIRTVTSGESRKRTGDGKTICRTSRPEAAESGTITTAIKRKCSATNSDLKPTVSQVISVSLPKKKCGNKNQDVNAGESSQTVKRPRAATPCQDTAKSKITSESECYGNLTKKTTKISSRNKIEKRSRSNECCVPVVESGYETRVDASSTLQQDLIVEVVNVIYVVVDTNVLLTDLVLFDKVKDFKGLPMKCNIILVIPWTVLQELDSIKCLSKSDGKELASNAQKAIKYLHSNFMNCHSRIRGQTVLEASINVGLPVECNDDRILQCCLQYQKKGGSNRVLLWTNDYNLNNKALVNSVKTCSQKGILATLQDVTSGFNKGEGSGKEPDRKQIRGRKPELAVAKSSPQIRKVNTVNAMFINVQDVMLKCLEPVLRNEMINAFDNLWTKIIIVQPPWTLKDVLHCMLKHWISVFGIVLRSSCQRSIQNLFDQLKSMTARAVFVKQKDVVSLTNSSLECLLLLEPCLGNHAVVIRKTICELQGFLMKCDDQSPATVKKEITPENESWASSVDRDSDAEMIDLSEELVAPETSKTVSDSDVLGVLQIVWEKINEFCGLILDSFNLKHSLRYAKPDVLPTQMESLTFLSRMICDISILSIRMRKMIEHFSEMSTPDGTFEDAFWNCLINFLPNLGFIHLQASQVAFEDPAAFINFCRQSENRKLLVEGFRQLQEFMTILNECVSMVRNANF